LNAALEVPDGVLLKFVQQPGIGFEDSLQPSKPHNIFALSQTRKQSFDNRLVFSDNFGVRDLVAEGLKKLS
jgi:hypothetical protein